MSNAARKIADMGFLRILLVEIRSARIIVPFLAFDVGRNAMLEKLGDSFVGEFTTETQRRHRGHREKTIKSSLCPLCLLCVSVVNSPAYVRGRTHFAISQTISITTKELSGSQVRPPTRCPIV